MTLPGFSGSFILILLGNYVLLLVDAVNALFDTLVHLFAGDFSILDDPATARLLAVLGVFTLGSVVGLIIFSHILGFVLKYYKKPTLAVILGFITGSLGVVWPWKKTIYKVDLDGVIVFDSAGHKVVANYERFIPELNNETYIAIAFIFVGILIVLGLEIYGQKTRKAHV